jgi:hypothetical protein
VKYTVKNWRKFQHYKDRNPIWIKLYVELLTSKDWVVLDDASRVLVITCMLLATKHNGVIDGSPAGLAYLKRVAYLNSTPNLTPLIESEFLIPQANASTTQIDAIPETETEERQRRKREEEKPGPQKIPSPSLDISEDPDEGPSVNPDPIPLARPGQPAQAHSPAAGAGKGISPKADHEEHSPGTRPQVSPPLADQPSPPPPGVERDDGLPSRSPRGRSGESNKALNTPGDCGVPKSPPPHEKASHGPRGDPPQRLGEIISQFKDNRPMGIEHDELLHIKQHHADRLKYEMDALPLRGELRNRMLEALRDYGYEDCDRATKGHARLADREGSSYGRGLDSCFPAERKNSARLDRAKFWKLVQAAPRKKIEQKPEPQLSEEEKKKLREGGKEGLRKAKEYLKNRNQDGARATAQEE